MVASSRDLQEADRHELPVLKGGSRLTDRSGSLTDVGKPKNRSNGQPHGCRSALRCAFIVVLNVGGYGWSALQPLHPTAASDGKQGRRRMLFHGSLDGRPRRHA